MKNNYGDIITTQLDNFVVQCEISRPPSNFFDFELIKDLADCFDDLDKSTDCRSIVLCSEGKHFCAGANFGRSNSIIQQSADSPNPIYTEAIRLFSCKKPVIAAVQGAAVGGGFGLALMADFRIVSPGTRMTANFLKLGFTPGFGLTHTLPRLIGIQKANLLFMTGRRIKGETAYEWGLGDVFAEDDKLREEAINLATEIATSAPLALLSLREQMRPGLAEAIKSATDIEGKEQFYLQKTEDHKEGIQSVAERRPGNFIGR
ncbi:MAG: enoyl-CoA hydratase/isomerase family protein [Pseudomonadales bacterium]|nr:enoyl-CoA hydratase/isomerase family protein [Pseudomonadales bacterium]